MRKYISLTMLSLLIVVSFFLGGCIQTKEHLVIDKDGSGTLEVNLMVPKGTRDFIDKSLGGMMQGMQEMMPRAGQETAELPKTSASEEMFANKKGILKKADEAGLNIEFVSFQKEIKDDSLYVSYKFKFDDINRLLASELIGTKVELAKDAASNLICGLKSAPEKANESKMQLKQFKDESEEPQPQLSEQDREMQRALMDAMRNFKAEFYITMPNQITEISGVFKQKDEKTAYLEFSGDLLINPELIDKVYGTTSEYSHVVCSAQDIDFDIIKIEDVEEVRELSDYPVIEKAAQKKRLHLNDGKVLEGKIVEENQKYIKIEVSSGITLTYPRSEIAKIE